MCLATPTHLKPSILSLSPDYGGARGPEGQGPARGLPVRSVSLDMTVSGVPQGQYPPVGTLSPYTLLQQQQGILANHTAMMSNQANLSGGWIVVERLRTCVCVCVCVCQCSAHYIGNRDWPPVSELYNSLLFWSKVWIRDVSLENSVSEWDKC